MTDYSELIARVRAPYALTERDAQEISDAIEAQAQEIAEKDAREAVALREATILAVGLAKKHWPENTSWQPLSETAGVITQINNMCAGLEARIAELEAALKPFAVKDTEVTPERQYYDMLVKHEDRVRARAALNGEK